MVYDVSRIMLITAMNLKEGGENNTASLSFRDIYNIFNGGDYMRKKLIIKLSQMYTRTFPPLTPNGNNAIGDVKRTIIAWLMFAVGGRKTKELLREVLTEFTEWYELHKGDLA